MTGNAGPHYAAYQQATRSDFGLDIIPSKRLFKEHESAVDDCRRIKAEQQAPMAATETIL